MNLLMNTIPMAEARLRRILRATLRLEGEELADMMTCTRDSGAALNYLQVLVVGLLINVSESGVALAKNSSISTARD